MLRLNPKKLGAGLLCSSPASFSRKVIGFLVFLVGIWASVFPAHADYLPLSGAEVADNIAEVRIENDGVHVQLEIYVGDAHLFQALFPDEWFTSGVTTRSSLAARLANFAENGLSVRRQNGAALPLRINRIEPLMRIDRTTALTGRRNPLTGREFPKPPDDPRVIFAELFYDFEGTKPEAIEIAPPAEPAVIGFVTFDRGVPVANFAYLSGPARLAIDWKDPWYSRFDNPNLRRHHQSGATTYLYVEPRELRHEILVRVRDIDPWLELNLGPGHQLSAQEQERIKSEAASFLAGRNPVTIDGEAALPAGVRAEFLTLDSAGLQIAEGRQDLSADEAFLGLILSFPWRGLPETVSVRWDIFNEYVGYVPATSTDPAGPFLSGASPEDPHIIWRNHLLTYENPSVTPVPAAGSGRVEVPLFVVGGLAVVVGAISFFMLSGSKLRALTGAAAAAGLGGTIVAASSPVVDFRNPFVRMPEVTEAEHAFEMLLDNIHIANLEISSGAREHALEPLTSTLAKSDVAAEIDRALAVRVPGGGIARVNEVSNLMLRDVVAAGNGFGFRALAEWTASASAGHWGHTHNRTVKYRALVEVIEEGGNWKLSEITVLEARLPNE